MPEPHLTPLGRELDRAIDRAEAAEGQRDAMTKLYDAERKNRETAEAQIERLQKELDVARGEVVEWKVAAEAYKEKQ